jgi:hypothetical protein
MKHKKDYRAVLIAFAILALAIFSPAASSLAAGFSEQPQKMESGDTFVGSFSVFFYNTYLLNPEGPVGEAPDNACRGQGWTLGSDQQFLCGKGLPVRQSLRRIRPMQVSRVGPELAKRE